MLPIKQLLSTFAPVAFMQITLLAVLTELPAFAPKAVLPLPVLGKSAPVPTAVFELPVALALRALLPTAVLFAPGSVAKEGENAGGRVLYTLGVAKERVTAGGCVLVAGGVAN